MPVDIIPMHPNTLEMSQIDGGEQFEVAVSINQDVMTSFDSTSDPEPQNLSLLLKMSRKIA